MGTLWAKFLSLFNLAYWITVETQDSDSKYLHSFGPFATSKAATASQETCCRLILQYAVGTLHRQTVYISQGCSEAGLFHILIRKKRALISRAAKLKWAAPSFE